MWGGGTKFRNMRSLFWSGERKHNMHPCCPTQVVEGGGQCSKKMCVITHNKNRWMNDMDGALFLPFSSSLWPLPFLQRRKKREGEPGNVLRKGARAKTRKRG